jgi:hypothetical protein
MSLKKTTLLTAHLILWYTKILILFDDFHFLFHRKNVIICWFHTNPIWSGLPKKLIYVPVILLQLFWMALPHRDSWHCKYQVSCPCCCLGCSKGTFQAWDLIKHFITYYLQWGVVSLSPTLKLEYHPKSALCDCLVNILSAHAMPW